MLFNIRFLTLKSLTRNILIRIIFCLQKTLIYEILTEIDFKQLCLVTQVNGDRCHSFWPTYSINVIIEGKRKGKWKETPAPRIQMGYRVFSDAHRIGKPKAVTSIPILLGHYRQLQDNYLPLEISSSLSDTFVMLLAKLSSALF